MRDSEYMGRNGFFWFHGVVEDRTDPEKLGRLRVRILGCHTKDKTYIKSEELQWAYVVQPLTSAAMNGLGNTPLGPVPGTWVFGFFRDGDNMQEPCILGTISGIPQKAAEPSEGFNDPRGYETEETLGGAPRKIQTRVYPTDGSGAQLTPESQAQLYPRTSHPLGCVVQESDVNRIARNEKINDTIIQTMKDMVDKGVPIAFEGTWDEKGVWYEGQYPFVHVFESESGHIHVTDDTPNKEGTLDWDRSGTFKETHPDGSEVHKIVKDGYTIVLAKNYIHIMNDQNERCDKEYNLSVGGRWNVEVKGNINLLCHQNLYAKINGNANISVDGTAKVKAATIHVKSGGEIKIGSGGKISIQSGGAFHITAGGTFAVDAPTIHFNSGVASPSAPSDPQEPKK